MSDEPPPENLKELRRLIRQQTDEQRDEVQGGLDAGDRNSLDHDWRTEARPEQLPPPGDWRVWLLLAGRGFGKTRSRRRMGARAGRRRSAGRIALVAPTAADARDVMVEGESGILADRAARDRPLYEPSKRRLTWPNGAVATAYSRRRAGPPPRPAARRRLVRRAGGVALSRGLGQADVRAAARRRSALRRHHHAEAGPAACASLLRRPTVV